MTIDALADKIIAERLDLEQKVCRVNEIQVRTLTAIDSAVGDDIEEAARQAVAESSW